MLNLNLILLLCLFPFFESKTVNNLHPSDIQCFGVIGDSVSAGFSLESHSIFKDLYEYRGKSFPIGGEEGYRTLPNIFSQYGSPKKCAAYGSTFITHSLLQYPTSDKAPYGLLSVPPIPPFGKEIAKLDSDFLHPKINCNVAISGAVSDQVLPMWNNLLKEW